MSVDVLLTGFEPFDDAQENPSWEAVRRAAPRLRERGIATVELELPVAFARAGGMLTAAVRAHRPQLVIATGLAAGRSGITPERVAINVRDARIPDNAGARPVDEAVVPGAPVGHLSTLPIKAMVATLTAAGTPASVSQTAGTYVCNDVFFSLQHLLATDDSLSGIRGGFVHVPAADVVDVRTAADALVRLVEVALETSRDIRATGGAQH